MKRHQPTKNYLLEFVLLTIYLVHKRTDMHSCACYVFRPPKQKSVEGLERSLTRIRMGAEFISTSGHKIVDAHQKRGTLYA
jgi:hypothetical protein